MPASIGLAWSIVILTKGAVDAGYTCADIGEESGVGVGARALILTWLEESARISGDIARLPDVCGVGTLWSKERRG